VETSRLEAFSDGVFAIAITLLVLEIAVPHIEEPGKLGQALLDLWPSYLAYATSFLTIGIMWINHHTVFRQLGEVDHRFLFINLGLLMLIAFVPFPSRLVAEHIRGAGAESAALAYGFTMTATAVCFNAVWLYASVGARLLRDDANPGMVAGITRTYLPGPLIYLGSALVAFGSATASVLLYLAITALYVVESSVFGGRQTAG